ncbi:NADPH:quinone reductase [Carnobacteriaceae bacterium 52-44]
MKAIQINEFGGPEVLKTVEIDEPYPNEDEVKVKVFVTGLNPSEAYTITGTYGYNVPNLPYVPGYDATGVIEEVGSSVNHFKKGDRVFLSAFSAERNTGTYAEKVVTDAKNVFRLPDNISFKEGAALGIPVFTAYKAIFLKANVRAGETVLVHGASGSVGSMAVQMAKAIGATVIGTSSTEEGRQTILDLGADHAMDHISEDNKEELLNITNEQGPDVIIEMLANANLETDMQVIVKYGRIIIVGSRDTIEVNPRNLMTSEAIVTGMTFTYPTQKEMKEMQYGVNALLEIGAIRSLIGNEFTLDEPVEAHKSLMESSGNGRTIFVVQEE